MNLIDLTPQFLISPFTTMPILFIGVVVIAAGCQPRYLAGFRNRPQFFAVITDVSAFFRC